MMALNIFGLAVPVMFLVSLNLCAGTDLDLDAKFSKTCLSSSGELGVCRRILKCKHFKLSSLPNNICFTDLFIPGVCCVEETDQGFETTTEKPSSTSDQSTNAISKKDEEAKLGCGVHTIPSSRIINGKEPPAGKWPWMAAVYILTFVGSTFHCGGSLISSRHVLTGAHCVKGKHDKTFSPAQIKVRLGDNNINTLEDANEEPGKFYRVEDVVHHPKFRNINQYFMNDVAILKLTEEVTFSDFVSPICLPPPMGNGEQLDKFAGKYSIVIGFGRTEVGVPSGSLLEAKVPVWKNKECDESYFSPITDMFICAGFRQGGADACQGDSGGPLQLKENGRWIQIGITSFGRGCGEAGFPGVYARVEKFVSWIKENMR